MEREVKYLPEQKIKACEDYLSGRKPIKEIARQFNMGKCGDCRVYEWVKMYKANGATAFEESHHNRSCSKEFKEKAVEEYLTGRGSLTDIAVKYGIPSSHTLRHWISSYNNHIELRDYNSKSKMFYGYESQYKAFEQFYKVVEKYIYYYNNERIQAKTKWMPPVKYRKASILNRVTV